MYRIIECLTFIIIDVSSFYKDWYVFDNNLILNYDTKKRVDEMWILVNKMLILTFPFS